MPSAASRERTRAQEGLQQAHDKLEERVKERTEQLKFEITARKESEVQFKAPVISNELTPREVPTRALPLGAEMKPEPLRTQHFLDELHAFKKGIFR